MEPDTRNTNASAKVSFQLEDLYLKIFKYTMVCVMSAALLAMLILLPMAMINYFQTPVAAPPIQTAPVKSINADDLKNMLIDEKKRDVIKEEIAKQKAAGTLPVNTVAAADVVFDQPYENLVNPMYQCLLAHLASVGLPVADANRVQEREQMRAGIEVSSKGSFKGEAWVQDLTTFACQILKDPAIIELRKDNKIGNVYRPLINFHSKTWVAIQSEKLAFEQNQQRQFDSFTAKELARVAAAKSTALIMASAAGAAFLLFIVLALYLIFAKIENNLGLIYRSIEAVKPRNNVSNN